MAGPRGLVARALSSEPGPGSGVRPQTPDGLEVVPGPVQWAAPGPGFRPQTPDGLEVVLPDGLEVAARSLASGAVLERRMWRYRARSVVRSWRPGGGGAGRDRRAVRQVSSRCC
ncbi:hypothetical protein SCMC78_41290 [Streptomyces sp. CMC78]|uniref:Uncharacterized protein n=1 Tax=Streptomyces sp. CMC78 TaxID=3231512 RepID=A0AB33KP49_9ACTN